MTKSNPLIKQTDPSTQGSDPLTLELLESLGQSQKWISPKFFYDQRGSQLFEKICEVEEYYVTRTEIEILREHTNEISDILTPDTTLFEYGSGSSTKTRILLSSLKNPLIYIPIDISKTHLLETASRLQREYPHLDIKPLCADFTHPISFSNDLVPIENRKMIFFPGSTLGNFEPAEASRLLKSTAQVLGPEGLLLLGIDLIKDKATLEAAYNDSEGVTAQFNLNALTHLNSKYGTDFDIEQFKHMAFFNSEKNRIEMHLVSLEDQQFQLNGVSFQLRKGETIHTENSHKYDFFSFNRLSRNCGFKTLRRWTDPDQLFAVYLLETIPE